MKIIIACDSFKESMSAVEACQAVEKGIKSACSHVYCQCIPMADGGEGTTEVLMAATNSIPHFMKAHSHNGEVIDVSYGINEDGIAIMETASCCGIGLVPSEKRNPTKFLSYGLGEMIKDAVNNGAKEIIIGVGGSGTNDGGFGMLYALGVQFYDKDGKVLPLEYASILKIASLDLKRAKDLLKNCTLSIASDVDNVFTGPNGATYTFGKQKGATDEQLNYLEKCLLHMQSVVFKQYGIDLSLVSKTGSAGGIGGALYLLGADMISGIDLVLKVTEFEKHIQDADYIITGEGSIDSQTIHGKTISGIAKLSSKYQKPVIAFGGRITKDAQNLYDIGVTAMFSITNEAKSLSQALEDGKETLEITVQNVCRLIL